MKVKKPNEFKMISSSTAAYRLALNLSKQAWPLEYEEEVKAFISQLTSGGKMLHRAFEHQKQANQSKATA